MPKRMMIVILLLFSLVTFCFSVVIVQTVGGMGGTHFDSDKIPLTLYHWDNGGSTETDLVKEVCAKFEEKYPQSFVVIDKNNGNYGSCINVGLKKANGTFVKILDADDSFDKESFKCYVKELIASEEKKEDVDAFINPPFYCDYGKNISVGKNLFINYNCTIIDVAKVTIGDNCLLAPNVAIYTAGHPIYPSTRNSLYEYGRPITIGDNVWIGGNSVICPGVNIGSNVVIGAGSVVTKDIPDWCVAVGNPCKVLRMITEDDKKKLFKNEEIDEEAWNDIVSRGF
jgi:maltose O-acetyltransferase